MSSLPLHHPTSSRPSSSTTSPTPRTRRPHTRRAASCQHPPHSRTRSTGTLPPLPRPRTPAMPVPSSSAVSHAGQVHQSPHRPSLPPSRSMTLYPRHSPRHNRPSGRVMSPSRLPQTDTLSYFPPFESMGSGPDLSTDEKAHSPLGSPNSIGRGKHTKGRSLGSIAGFVNSFGLFTRKTTDSADEDAVQALSKRVTPGKRKVLETISLANQDIKLATRKVSDGKAAAAEGEGNAMGTARSPAKAETQPSKRPSLHLPIPEPSWRVPLPSPPVASISPLIPAELFAFFVDNPATVASSPPESHIPSLPHAVTHAQRCSSRRSSTSSTKSLRSVSGDKETISPVNSFSILLDSSLEGEASSSEPCTPEKSWVQGTIIPPTLAFSDSLKTFSSQIDTSASARSDETAIRDDDEEEELGSPSRNVGYLGHRLRPRPRAGSSASARSADSNRTIRPGTYAPDDITPKAGRGWRAVRDEEDGIVHFHSPESSPGLPTAPEHDS